MIVEVEGLHHRYGPRTVLAGLEFGVEDGEMFGILGPNGCGKSTLFRVLATLLPVQQGRVRIDGIDIAQSARAARERLGVVFQGSSLDKRLTVNENMLAQGALYGLSGTRLRERTSELLAAFHLQERAGELAATLSGGLRRRLEIAKALLHGPRVLLLDEASAGLDPGARRELIALLDHLRREQGLTTLFTTHLMDEAESATRLMLLHGGRAACIGKPERLKADLSGDVVVFRQAVEGLAPRLRERFSAEVHEDGCIVRVEIPDGHRFLAAALDAFPGCAQAVEVHRPSLEDAFLHHTGVRFHA